MYNVPGVYVKEDDKVRLSVTTGATAVPAFLFDKADFGGAAYKRYNSWLAVIDGLKEKSEETAFHRTLRIYFENGGGYCYAIDKDAIELTLEALDDVTLVVQAGQKDSKDAMKTACEKLRVFGIYDAVETSSAGLTLASPVNVGKGQGAAYGPKLKDKTVDYPASAAVAGVYCRVDRERGVWKAPANVAIAGGYSVDPLSVAPELEEGVNAIRTFNGGPPLVWGARTLEPTGPWRFVPVRRLFNAVEKDIKKAMNVAVFEPNNAYTWEMVRSAIDNYLHQLWTDGALLGETPEEAYSVLVGLGVTMTDQDLRNGEMKVKVGLSAVRPAEQIILQFSQKMNGA